MWSEGLPVRGRGGVAVPIERAEAGLQIGLGQAQLASQALHHASAACSHPQLVSHIIMTNDRNMYRVGRAWYEID